MEREPVWPLGGKVVLGNHPGEAGGGCDLEEGRSQVRLGAASQAERERAAEE